MEGVEFSPEELAELEALGEGEALLDGDGFDAEAFAWSLLAASPDPDWVGPFPTG